MHVLENKLLRKLIWLGIKNPLASKTDEFLFISQNFIFIKHDLLITGKIEHKRTFLIFERQ